jgi:hypothetical protein
MSTITTISLRDACDQLPAHDEKLLRTTGSVFYGQKHFRMRADMQVNVTDYTADRKDR